VCAPGRSGVACTRTGSARWPGTRHWIMCNEYLASGRWWKAVEGAPRSRSACGECIGPRAAGGSCAGTVGSWDRPEGCARSGNGIWLAKGRVVRAGSRGRGLHAIRNRVGAVSGHAALNHVTRISCERAIVEGRRDSRVLPGRSRCGRGAAKEPVVIAGWVVPRLRVSSRLE
jgi:hypothetical protein